MKKLSTTLLAVIGLTSAAAYAAPGAYVQMQGGIGGMDTKKYSATSTPTTDNPYSSISLRHGIAYRLSTGYLWEQNQLDYGVELGYGSYPKNKYKIGSLLTETYSGSNIDLLGVAKYRFTCDTDQGFYAIGKAGVARVSQKLTASSSYADSSSKSVHAIKPELVVGGGYDFNRNVSLDLTYQHIFGSQANPNPFTASENGMKKASSVNTLMAGISYHFS